MLFNELNKINEIFANSLNNLYLCHEFFMIIAYGQANIETDSSGQPAGSGALCGATSPYQA